MDDCMKLLDNGWIIQLFQNGFGSYTAMGFPPGLQEAMDDAKSIGDDIPEPIEQWITDDFTPSKALHRLTEKALFGRIV